MVSDGAQLINISSLHEYGRPAGVLHCIVGIETHGVAGPNLSPTLRIPVHNIPSVGQEAARLMELDPDKKHWRQVVKDWFARGLAITPNSGKLQHHLGLLSRNKDGMDEELRGIYHFVKRCVFPGHVFPANTLICVYL